jgi:hypothetical protein
MCQHCENYTQNHIFVQIDMPPCEHFSVIVLGIFFEMTTLILNL